MQEHSSDAIQKKAACLARSRDALNDVKRGRLIDGESVMTWIRSWGRPDESDLLVQCGRAQPIRIGTEK